MKCCNFACWFFLSITGVYAQELRLQRMMFPIIEGSYSNRLMLLAGGVNNPSALAMHKGLVAAVEMEQSFLLKEGRLFSAIVVHPFRLSLIGMTVTHSGYTGYTQSAVSLLFGRNLGKILLGTEFTFHHTMVAGYENAGSVNAGISCRLQLSPPFNTGFRIRNITGLFIKNENVYAPIVQAGAGYDVSEAVHISCEWIHEPGRSPTVITGLLYRFHRLFIVTFGTVWSPCQPYGGFQLQQGNWKFLLKASFHPVLGWSPSLGISIGKMYNDQE